MLDWMVWTLPTAVFFVAIAALLLFMWVAEIIYPTSARRGFLGFTTTRGERLFMGLLMSAYLHLVWIVFFSGIATISVLSWVVEIPLWWFTILCAMIVAVMLRWG